MKIKQQRVNKRTAELGAANPAAQQGAEENRLQAEELAERQRKVEALLREIANRMQKQEGQ